MKDYKCESLHIDVTCAVDDLNLINSNEEINVICN